MRAALAASSVVRRVFWSAVAASLVCSAWQARAGAKGPGDVRPLQARGRRLLASGAGRSTTFSRLLDEIATSDVIVYVDLDPYAGLEHQGIQLDGLLRFVGIGSETRFVVVWLRPQRTDDEMIVSLAHELHHAVEVVRARDVTSQDALLRLYRRIGRSDNPGRFETEAAQETAARVAAELRQPGG
jgi:hypothetical protein